MDIKEKATLSTADIQKITGCGRGSAYALVNEAKQKNLFPVKQIGKKFYIPAEPFWNWFNTN
ncbi:hypothetical protein [uncultured Oscillibacter sp.]|uniref:hypothetical protein n=1 Tax=uncultured Oscillibacter sp. TaxID=876091 RepID=UPI0025DF577B|nr:hypothetical protein [uncultured Oscillibacter sp.]